MITDMRSTWELPQEVPVHFLSIWLPGKKSNQYMTGREDGSGGNSKNENHRFIGCKSVSLDAAPSSKSAGNWTRQWLLWCRAVRSAIRKHIVDRCMREKRRVPPESVKELRFPMANVMRLTAGTCSYGDPGRRGL